MKILKGSITSLSGRGYITLQVPDCEINLDVKEGKAWMMNAENAAKTEDVPNEWLESIKNNRRAFGREHGFLYLTRAGWIANKSNIQAAFNASTSQRGTWAEFEAYAEKHLDEVDRKTKKHKEKMLKKYLDK